MNKPTYEQCSDEQLNDLIARGLGQPYAVEERSYRSAKKMLEFAGKLDIQTAQLIKFTRRLLVFTIVIVILTAGLLALGFLQIYQAHQSLTQPPHQIQQTNQTDKITHAENNPK